MRLPEADIAIIDRAATLRGRSRTDFVRDAAVRAAEDALMDVVLGRLHGPVAGRCRVEGAGPWLRRLGRPQRRSAGTTRNGTMPSSTLASAKPIIVA